MLCDRDWEHIHTLSLHHPSSSPSSGDNLQLTPHPFPVRTDINNQLRPLFLLALAQKLEILVKTVILKFETQALQWWVLIANQHYKPFSWLLGYCSTTQPLNLWVHFLAAACKKQSISWIFALATFNNKEKARVTTKPKSSVNFLITFIICWQLPSLFTYLYLSSVCPPASKLHKGRDLGLLCSLLFWAPVTVLVCVRAC